MSDPVQQAISIPIKVLDNAKGLALPEYATPQAAGMDIVAAIDGDIVLKPLERCMVATGLAIALPPGFEAQIRPRSGLAAKSGITVLNSPGTVDADFRGEIKILMVNFSNADFKIERGMRIAQMVVARHERIDWSETSELGDTERGEGGFGSTGTK